MQNNYFMKLKISLYILLFISTKFFSQQVSDVLFTIDKEPYYTSEFIKVYKKNNALIQNPQNTDIENSLELFVAYKLKVKEAKDDGIDTLQSFKRELNSYKKKLVSPYLKDEKVTSKLVQEAYNRLQTEINASHILIFLKPDAIPQDTLAAYHKIMEAQKLISAGEDFSIVAKKYSQDPSVAKNGGEIGYFSALQMVYQFENVAYSTKENEVSKPFRTKFGYHILKVNAIRPAKGEVEVAHIMRNNNSENAKVKIDSIYKLLQNNPSQFEALAKEFSEDNSSAINGGKLRKFSSGQMIEDFSNVAFSLKNEGDLSMPFKTDYGWHIVKLLHKHPIQSFDVLEQELLRKVEGDSRSELIGKPVIDSLLAIYNVSIHKEALEAFDTNEWKTTPENFTKTLFTIEHRKINQTEFIAYLNSIRNSSIDKDFESFKNKEILNYFENNIQLTNKKFAAIYKEFEEGMLLFEMLEKQVWEKSKDSVGLANFYKLNKTTKYASQELAEIRGLVISDYQTYLEKLWIQALYKKYNVLFNEKEKTKVLTTEIIE